MTILADTLPWLWIRSFSGLVLLVAHLIFALNFVLILLRVGEERKTPALFAASNKEELVTV
jgi:hypothetical protein